MSVLLARHHRQRRLRDPNRDRAVAPPHDDDERLPGDTRGLDRNVGGRKPAEDRRERRSVDRPSCENRGVTTLRDDRCATDAEEGSASSRLSPSTTPTRSASTRWPRGRRSRSRTVPRETGGARSRSRRVAVEAGLVGQPRGGGAVVEDAGAERIEDEGTRPPPRGSRLRATWPDLRRGAAWRFRSGSVTAGSDPRRAPRSRGLAHAEVPKSGAPPACVCSRSSSSHTARTSIRGRARRRTTTRTRSARPGPSTR